MRDIVFLTAVFYSKLQLIIVLLKMRLLPST